MRVILVLFLALTSFGCGYSRHSQMTQPGVVPVITAISPSSVSHGGPGFMLTVNGSNFNANAVVNWNGTMQTTNHPAMNQLTVQIPASDIANMGMVSVTVTNPGSSTPGGPYGGGTNIPMETSNSMTFTIT